MTKWMIRTHKLVSAIRADGSEMSMLMGLVGNLKTIIAGPLDGAANLVFYSLINDFLRDEISEFQDNLLGRTMFVLGAAILSVLTLWILLQGFRIVTGRSRDSMMGLVTDSLRAMLIVGIATGLAAGNSTVYRAVTDGMGSSIYGMVTNETSNINEMYDTMDKNLIIMNVAMARLDSLQTGGDEKMEAEKSRAQWMAGLGTAGPAMAAGVMLTLNKVALAIFTGLGPLFVLCLLFDQTKSLFQRWLLYGIGTMFSLAVLYVMVILATDTVVAVAGAFWMTDLLDVSGKEGLKTIALQQGGLGLIMTMLLISVPPMAAAFFQGTLGNFMHYNAFDSGRGGGKDGFRNSPSAAAPAGAPAPNRLNSESQVSDNRSSGPAFNSGRVTSSIDSGYQDSGEIRKIENAQMPKNRDG